MLQRRGVFTQRNLFLILIFALALFLRLYQLGNVPLGVTHDEMGYVYNAYSIATTGKNVFSEQFPLLTWMVSGGFPFLPVPIYIGAFFFQLSPLSAFAGRLPSALLGSFDVLLLFYITRKLIKRDSIAYLSSLFLAISPWHLHFSRSAYDPNFSLFFYLLAITLSLYEGQKKLLPIFSSLSFLLAVFSYRGMSPVFLPLALLTLWYVWSVYHLKRKEVLYRVLGMGVVLICFGAVALFSGRSYTQEALFFTKPTLQEEVDKHIREATGPLFLRRLFINKATYAVAELRENYTRIYSSEFLFLFTEPHRIYSIWSRGRVYFLDIFFLLPGAFLLFTKHKKQAAFVLGCILIGGIPGMLAGLPYSARTFFIAAFLPILTASGIVGITQAIKNRMLQAVFVGVVSLLYFYSLGSYLFDYYARYAYQGAEAWAKSLKDVSLLAWDRKSQFDRVVISNTSFGDLVQYAFYTGTSPLEVQQAWMSRSTQASGKDEFAIGVVRFVPDCYRVVEDLTGALATLVIVRDNCKVEGALIEEIKDYPGNTLWRVYEVR